VTLLAILVACATTGVLLMSWARRPDMCLLYSRLSREEAGRIAEKIRDADIPYQLKDGGTTILVPEEKVYSLRLSLASQGMPAGEHAGYKILDDEKIGSSPFSQRVNYVRALEGELARTIELLNGVASARVHVVRPQGTLFAGQRASASATVMLRLKPGKRLSDGNVAAIVHLLAGSVEGLSPEDVVVADAEGNLLSGEATTEMARGAGTFLDYKSRVEQYLAGKAEEMLTAVLGPGHASVRVDAVIAGTSSNQKTETFDPDKKVVTKEEIKSKSSSPGSEKTGGAGASTKEDTTISEYMVSRTVKEEAELPGKIESLSVAILVDLTPPSQPEGDQATAAQATLTEEDVKDIAQKATGASEEDITVKVATFHRPWAALEGPPEKEEGFFGKSFILEVARRMSLGLLVIGALLALKIFGSGKGKPGVAALDGRASEGGNLLPASAAPADAEALRRRITRALQENPEEVKRLFLNWVESDKGEV